MHVIEFNRAELRAEGLTDQQIDQGYDDLGVILAELARDPSSPVAVTEVADLVLHNAIDHGFNGVDHDPNAWGTPRFEQSWMRTVAAFGRHGVALDSDPAAPRADGRGAMTCFVTARNAA